MCVRVSCVCVRACVVCVCLEALERACVFVCVSPCVRVFVFGCDNDDAHRLDIHDVI